MLLARLVGRIYNSCSQPRTWPGGFAMLKLYGFSVSNYYNMVKLALLGERPGIRRGAFFCRANTASPGDQPAGQGAGAGCQTGLYQRNQRDPRIHRANPGGPLAAAGRTVSARSGADIVQGNRAVHRAARPRVFRRSVFRHAGAGGDQGQSPGPSCCWGWGR